MKDYNKGNIPFAKTLRKNMTPWERKVWYDFLRDYSIRFQRQKAVENYILDFYCAKARLVIELDGGGHYTPEQAEKDLIHIKELEAMNLKVIRFCNLDIDRNFSGVCTYINMAVQVSFPQSASLPGGVAKYLFCNTQFRRNLTQYLQTVAHCATVPAADSHRHKQ